MGEERMRSWNGANHFERVLAAIENCKGLPTDKAIYGTAKMDEETLDRVYASASNEQMEKIEAAKKKKVLDELPDEEFLKAIHINLREPKLRLYVDLRFKRMMLKAIKESKKPPSDSWLGEIIGVDGTVLANVKRRLESSSPKDYEEIEKAYENWMNALEEKVFLGFLDKMPKPCKELRKAVDKRLARVLLRIASQMEEEPTDIGMAREAGISTTSIDGLKGRDSGFAKKLEEERARWKIAFVERGVSTAIAFLSLFSFTKPIVYDSTKRRFAALANERSGRKFEVHASADGSENTIYVQPPFSSEGKDVVRAINSLVKGGAVVIALPQDAQVDFEALEGLASMGFAPRVMEVNSHLPDKEKSPERLDTFVILIKNAQVKLERFEMPFVNDNGVRVEAKKREKQQQNNGAPLIRSVRGCEVDGLKEKMEILRACAWRAARNGAADANGKAQLQGTKLQTT